MPWRDHPFHIWWIVLLLLAGLSMPVVGIASPKAVTRAGTTATPGVTIQGKYSVLSCLFDQARIDDLHWGPVSRLIVDSSDHVLFLPQGAFGGGLFFGQCRGYLVFKDGFGTEFSLPSIYAKFDTRGHTLKVIFTGVVKSDTGGRVLLTVTEYVRIPFGPDIYPGQCIATYPFANDRLPIITVHGDNTGGSFGNPIFTGTSLTVAINGITVPGTALTPSGTTSTAVFGTDDATLTLCKPTP